jgi:hypothetical protein
VRGLSRAGVFPGGAFLRATLRIPVAFLAKLGGLRHVRVGNGIFLYLFAGVLPSWNERLCALIFNGWAGFSDFLDLLGGDFILDGAGSVLCGRLLALLRKVLLKGVFFLLEAGFFFRLILRGVRCLA